MLYSYKKKVFLGGKLSAVFSGVAKKKKTLDHLLREGRWESGSSWTQRPGRFRFGIVGVVGEGKRGKTLTKNPTDQR